MAFSNFRSCLTPVDEGNTNIRDHWKYSSTGAVEVWGPTWLNLGLKLLCVQRRNLERETNVMMIQKKFWQCVLVSHTHAFTHTHTCTHARTHIYAHTNTHTNVHTYTCTHICAHIDAHTRKHAHIHAHMHAHTHTHTEKGKKTDLDYTCHDRSRSRHDDTWSPFPIGHWSPQCPSLDCVHTQFSSNNGTHAKRSLSSMFHF